MLADTELADIVNRGHETPEGLTSPDWARYSAYAFIQFNAWEYCFYLNQKSLVPRELWEGANSYFQSLATTKRGWLRFWQEESDSFAEPFHSYAMSHFPNRADQSSPS